MDGLLLRTSMCSFKCLYSVHCISTTDVLIQVPLNYSEPEGEKAAIALTRYPAAVPADSPLYRGPVLFNPGGPGGSGVDMIALAGSALAVMVGPEFDIIGFDPRGTCDFAR